MKRRQFKKALRKAWVHGRPDYAREVFGKKTAARLTWRERAAIMAYLRRHPEALAEGRVFQTVIGMPVGDELVARPPVKLKLVMTIKFEPSLARDIVEGREVIE